MEVRVELLASLCLRVCLWLAGVLSVCVCVSGLEKDRDDLLGDGVYQDSAVKWAMTTHLHL